MTLEELRQKKHMFHVKCRRCETIEELIHLDIAPGSHSKFIDDMFKKAKNPEFHFCDTCNFTTIRDLVSFINKRHPDDE